MLHITIPSNLDGPMNYFKLKKSDIPALVWVDKVNNEKAQFNEAEARKEAESLGVQVTDETTYLEIIAHFVKIRAEKFYKKWKREVLAAKGGSANAKMPGHNELR